MTFEERIHEYCLQSDIVYERILSLSCEKDLYILYPAKLANEQILKDNIPKMLKVIKEYISELELCAYCMRKVDNLYFDFQKIVIINEAQWDASRCQNLQQVQKQ